MENKIKKWSKIESCFEHLFVEYSDLSEDKKAEINDMSGGFYKYFISRTATTVFFMKNGLTQHYLSQEVTGLIDFSIIEELPDRCPEFLKSFYVVFKNPQKNVKALWGFYDAPYLIICGEKANKGLISSLFLIDFENKKYDFGKEELYSKDGLYFIKFLLTFSLLLEAEKTPFFLKKDLRRCSPNVYGREFVKTFYDVKIKENFKEE